MNELPPLPEPWVFPYPDREMYSKEQLREYARKAVESEREACAKVCDDIRAKYKWPDDGAERVASEWCADSIRARR